MHNTTTPVRLLAIAGGAGCVVGALIILLGESIRRPDQWTIYHLLTVLMISVTIAFFHLQVEAFRARHYFAALGFLVLSITGTALVVVKSVGRQAAVAESTVLSAEAVNQAIFDKKTELQKARARFDEASQYGDGEMKGERCGPRCRDWRLRATEVQAHIRQLEREIAALGPQKPVNSEAQTLADMGEVFGLNRAKSVTAVTLFTPFILCLMFEIGSIVSLSYAFQPRVSETVSPETVTGGGGKALRLVEKADPDAAIVKRILHSNPGISNDELAALMAVTKGEASKRVAKAIAVGTVSKVRAGRQVALYAH